MRLQVRVVAVALAVTMSGATSAAVHGLGPAGTSRAGRADVVVALGSAAPPGGVLAEASRSASLPPVTVTPLRTLRLPDLVVHLVRPLTAAQGLALHGLRGIEGLTVLDLGTVRIDGTPARLAGVNPSQFREFTPRETASSDALWASVGRGELASTYGLARQGHLRLGLPAAISAQGTVPTRVGAVAVFGLPEVDAVVSRPAGAQLGLPTASAVVLNAPSRDIDSLVADVRTIVGRDARIEVVRLPTLRATRRPATYRELYIESARYCPGLPWQVLAAIGQVESGHGRNVGPSSAGALGPMQFLPSTWAYYGVDGDGDGTADIMSPYDAVPAAALYLCRNGAGQGGQALYDAVFAYNHADWYVREILALAARYT